MQRSKVMAVALALVSAGAAAVVFAGTASAAEWHLYKGDMDAGHAYALEVPADAESVEFFYDGPESGFARLAVHDARGAKLGYYALDATLASATLASPAAGRHIVYVYEIGEGALKVRVNAPLAPPLDLQEMRLAREDVTLGSFEPGALDKVMTTTLQQSPVFVTLLYEGSAQGLDATVASAKGDVVTIAGETATAFSPGVWTAHVGERAFDPAHLDGATYTVTVSADRFEGHLVLTTLAIDVDAPPKASASAESNVSAPVAEPDLWDSSSDALALREGKAYALDVAAPGLLLVADPLAFEDNHRKDADDNRSDDRDRWHDVLSVYTPDDRLLAHVELHHWDDDEPVAQVELPVAGEYVLYVHRASNEVLLAKLAADATRTSLRELPLVNASFEFQAESLGYGMQEAQPFKLARIPVALQLETTQTSTGALPMIRVENDRGGVAGVHALVLAPGARMLAWSWENPENFRAGEHELRVDGFFDGGLKLTATSYVRDAAAPVPAALPADTSGEDSDDSDDDSDGEPPAPPAPPSPPAAPVAGTGLMAWVRTLVG